VLVHYYIYYYLRKWPSGETDRVWADSFEVIQRQRWPGRRIHHEARVLLKRKGMATSDFTFFFFFLLFTVSLVLVLMVVWVVVVCDSELQIYL
jgi:hypothetical protein